VRVEVSSPSPLGGELYGHEEAEQLLTHAAQLVPPLRIEQREWDVIERVLEQFDAEEMNRVPWG
jgi:hypothetical protein